METDEKAVRKQRNSQKLSMQIREAALRILMRIPISLSNYRELMWKVVQFWYVS
jgi:hypothetical protein